MTVGTAPLTTAPLHRHSPPSNRVPTRKQVTDMLGSCRGGACAGRMDRTMRELLDGLLPHDADKRCNGNFFAGVTVMEGGE